MSLQSRRVKADTWRASRLLVRGKHCAEPFVGVDRERIDLNHALSLLIGFLNRGVKGEIIVIVIYTARVVRLRAVR